MDDDEKKMDDSEYWNPVVDMPIGDAFALLDDHQCPRCGGMIPNNETPGAYVGAISRYDNATEICSNCGTEEAMLQFAAGGYRGDGTTLDTDHSQWYVVMVEAIMAATTKEEAKAVLMRLLG